MNLSKENTSIIKGLAICAMLFHHLFYLHPEYGKVTHILSLYGKICVSMFVIVSGYGLSVGFENIHININNSIKFILKRLIKFYINYWFIFVIFVPLGVLLGRSLEQAYDNSTNIYMSLFKDILGIQGFSSYNITWWFNKLIIQLYILFPIIYILLRKNQFLCFVFTLFTYKFLWNGEYILVFYVGILLRYHKDIIDKYISYIDDKKLIFISMILFVIASIFRQSILSFLPHGVTDIFVLLPMCLLIINGSKYISPKILKSISFLGRHSSNIYMIHTFIFYYFFHNYIYYINNPVVIFINLLLSSCLLSIFIEMIKSRLKIEDIEKKIIKKISAIGYP